MNIDSKQPFNGSLSRTMWVGWYPKKHSATHSHPVHQRSFINFQLHPLRSVASYVFNLHAWQSFSTISLQILSCLLLGQGPLLHTPYISSPRKEIGWRNLNSKSHVKCCKFSDYAHLCQFRQTTEKKTITSWKNWATNKLTCTTSPNLVIMTNTTATVEHTQLTSGWQLAWSCHHSFSSSHSTDPTDSYVTVSSEHIHFCFKSYQFFVLCTRPIG